METTKLWACNGDAVRQAIELGALVPRDTASAAWTDAVLWLAINSGLVTRWAASFPAPRCEPGAPPGGHGRRTPGSAFFFSLG